MSAGGGTPHPEAWPGAAGGLLPRESEYGRLCRAFAWPRPERFNIGVAVCDRHATGAGRLAMIFIDESGREEHYSFDRIKALSNRFANQLHADGLRRGDRLAVLLAQSPELAVAHVAAFKSGLISVPLFNLFGTDALEFRLRDSGARGIVTDLPGAEKLARIRDRLPALEHVYVVGADQGGRDNTAFHETLQRASDRFEPVATAAEDPAIIIYTSGTTGDPKGALHAHRVLLGHAPGMEMLFDFFPQPGDLAWTPADWAWIGGLFDILLVSWFYGVPVVARRAPRFDPEAAIDLMRRVRVRNVFMPPTALRMLRQSGARTDGTVLRTMFSGGEALGVDILEWVRSAFGIDVHEGYGQTECNVILANNSRLFPIRPGSMGRPVPGHELCVLSPEGEPLPPGETGLLAVRRPDPVMMLGYWNNPDATASKWLRNYLNTGDLAVQDDDGYFWYRSRSDDVINSGGYRIGPTEIEECLCRHPAVAMAAVVGVPDPIRGEAIKAWIVPAPGCQPGPALVQEIQDFVRDRLAAHEYPRHVAFADALPMTLTGKIRRAELRARG